MRDIPHALRYTWRLARRDPGSVALAVVTLALAIAATTAAMSVAMSVLQNPLPLRDDSRLVFVTRTIPTGSALVPFAHWG